MSFTQKKGTNLHTGPDVKFCDGCDKRCKLGHSWYTGWELSRNRLTSYCCPTIDGQEIPWYKGPDGEIVAAYRIYDGCTPHQKDRMLEQIDELTHKIVKYCDHYKTR
ncbi:MAG: hypothetical protein R8M70_04565 [Alphaproteobacteria bacterium]|nr:hypothetical protein [Alphaproteobacteria bacterium]